MPLWSLPCSSQLYVEDFQHYFNSTLILIILICGIAVEHQALWGNELCNRSRIILHFSSGSLRAPFLAVPCWRGRPQCCEVLRGTPVWWFWAGGAWGRWAVVVSGLWDGTSLRGRGSISSVPGGLRLWVVPRARGQAAISCCPPQPHDCHGRRWWGEAWHAERLCTKNNLEERHPAVGHTWSCFKTYVKPPGSLWRSAQQREWLCGLPDNRRLTGLQPGPGHFVRRWADGHHFPVRLHPSIWLCRQYGFSLWA